ncbi:TRAP transporter small permease [Comamonadaceae bacterium OH2545_COT-014]|nr:TRAP transporter small permease [Comamonadaceae bacterium OH2545_COT-014]
MRGFLSLVALITRAGAVMAALVIAAMVGHILLEIVLRAAFDRSTYVLDEFVGYGVAASTFLGLGHALERGSLIRVNLLLPRVRHRKLRQGLELLCVTACFAVFALVWWSFCKSVTRHWARGSVSETMAQVPLWVPEGLLLLGLSIFMLQLLAYALRVVCGQPMLGERVESETSE